MQSYDADGDLKKVSDAANLRTFWQNVDNFAIRMLSLITKSYTTIAAADIAIHMGVAKEVAITSESFMWETRCRSLHMGVITSIITSPALKLCFFSTEGQPHGGG